MSATDPTPGHASVAARTRGDHATTATNRLAESGSDKSARSRERDARIASRSVEQEGPPVRTPHENDRPARRDLVSLDPAICGFPGVQLGGYVAAALLQNQNGTVKFHAPVKPHVEIRRIDEGLVDAEGRVLVSGRPGATDITAQDPVSIDAAHSADRTMVA